MIASATTESTVTESQQQHSNGYCLTAVGSLGTEQQDNSMMCDGDSLGGKGQDVVGYADANNGRKHSYFPRRSSLAAESGLESTGVRGKVRGARRGRPFSRRGVRRAQNSLPVNSELDAVVGLAEGPGCRGRRYSSRGACGAGSYTNPLYHDVMDGASYNTGVDEMPGASYTGFTQQLSAASGPDVNFVHQYPYAASYAGVLKPRVLAHFLSFFLFSHGHRHCLFHFCWS